MHDEIVVCQPSPRLRPSPLMDAGNAGMIALAKQQEMSEDDLILTLLEKVSGKPVPATIWEKP